MSVNGIQEGKAQAAQRLRAARVRSGRGIDQLSDLLGIAPAAVRDLETFAGELFSTISLQQFTRLACLVGVSPQFLAGCDSSEVGRAQLPIEVVVEAIKRVMAEAGETADQFAARVGWDIARSLSDPQTAWTDWNLDALIDVCDAVGLHWAAILPKGDRCED